MFFEPPPAREELTSPPRPALPAWSAPPGTELGAATTADRVLARGPDVVVAQPFEFAVEWPLGGIGLTFTELDGAAVVSAARRSAPYWP